MDHAFWHERWQLNLIGFHNETINPHLQTFWSRMNVAKARQVFVPLCGKSLDLLWLRAQAHEVIGVELSPLAVRAFFAENDLEPTASQTAGFTVHEADGLRLYCGDFFALTPDQLGDVGAVWDRASLVALPPEMRVAYAAHLQRLLRPECQILLVAFDYAQCEMQGPPFSVQKHEVEALYGHWCDIEWLGSEDVLTREPHFRQRGLSALDEQVYLLTVR